MEFKGAGNRNEKLNVHIRNAQNDPTARRGVRSSTEAQRPSTEAQPPHLPPLDLSIPPNVEAYHARMAAEGLLWNPDNVRDVAESVGISNLAPETVRAVSQEVEYRVGQVIQEATRFMHHSRRTVLGTQDISQALAVLNVEPLYGYDSTRPLKFGEASLGPGQPLFYVEDEEIDFEKLINAPLPKVPRDITITAHWLAIEGVQPNIPQNPTTAEARLSELVAKGPGANPALGAFAGLDNTTFKPSVKHILSKELILYFNKIVAALIDEAEDEDTMIYREAALSSIRIEPGLHNLVPYFISYVNEKITHSISSIHIAMQMLRLVENLLENKSLFLTPYATSMCPAIMTCLVGPRIGPIDSTDHGIFNQQYRIRLLAAGLLGRIVLRYGKETRDLKTRLIRSCFKVLCDSDKSLPQHFGACTGMSIIGGPEVFREFVLASGVVRVFDGILRRAQRLADAGKDKIANEFNKEMVTNCFVHDIRALLPESGPDKEAASDGPALEKALGQIVGSRVAMLEDSKLNKHILDTVREGDLETERIIQQGGRLCQEKGKGKDQSEKN